MQSKAHEPCWTLIRSYAHCATRFTFPGSTVRVFALWWGLKVVHRNHWGYSSLSVEGKNSTQITAEPRSERKETSETKLNTSFVVFPFFTIFMLFKKKTTKLLRLNQSPPGVQAHPSPAGPARWYFGALWVCLYSLSPVSATGTRQHPKTQLWKVSWNEMTS